MVFEAFIEYAVDSVSGLADQRRVGSVRGGFLKGDFDG